MMFGCESSSPECLHRWADISSIATFLLALGGALWVGPHYFWRLRELRKKQKTLENYLKSEQETRSLLRIVGATGLTQDEIIQASFRSQHIRRVPIHDNKTTLTVGILFQYVETPELRRP
jgi:hypothetical protein